MVATRFLDSGSFGPMASNAQTGTPSTRSLGNSVSCFPRAPYSRSEPLMLLGAAVNALAWMAAIAVLIWIEKNRRNGLKLALPVALTLGPASLVYILA